MAQPEFMRDAAEGSERSRNYWCGTVGTTWWFYFTGRSTDEVWNAYVEHCRAMLDSNTERPSLICVCRRADSPTADQRRMIAEFIQAESKRLSSLLGFALVLDSPLHVLALKAINWLVKKPFPETVCGSPSSAAQWLVERGAPLDPQALASAFEAHVPREHRWVM